MGNEITQSDRIMRYAHLIQMQTGKAVRPFNEDGYVNLMTRYGTSKDSSTQYKFAPEPPVPNDVLTRHYEGNGLFAKIIDAPAEEAIKHGFKLNNIKDQKLEDFYTEALEELDWDQTAETAIKWARLFGGSIAVMLINDGRGLEEPIDWKNIKSIDDIRVYDCSVIQPDMRSMFNYDPRNPFGTRGSRLGSPEWYDVNSKYGTFRVHDSRCLVFKNGLLPENTSNSIYEQWGMPEFIRLNKAIQDAELAHRSAPKLLDRSVQPIYKMQNLAAELATEEGEERVLKRLQAIDMARGMLNSITIDATGEDYDFRTFQFSGINDVVGASCNLLSALSNIPQVILFGQPIGNMGATDDTSMENWYNYVDRIRVRMMKGNLRYLLSVIFQAGLATGEVDEIPKIKIEFEPLWNLSEVEKADLEQKKAQTQLIKAQTAQTYVDMQAIDASEVRKKLADSEEFDVENILDEYGEEEIFPEEPEEAEPTGHGIFEKGQFGEFGNDVDLEKAREMPEGNSPDAAPAATKLPQDMTAEENTEVLENTDAEDSKGGVGVIVVKDGLVLCGTRHNDSGYGLICGPGGHVEVGESPEEAAKRETNEEFGIIPTDLILIGRGPSEPETGISPYIYLCTEYEGEPVCDDLEMVNPRFRTLKEINELKPSLFPPFLDGLNVLFGSIEHKKKRQRKARSAKTNISENLLDNTHNNATITVEKHKEDGGPGSGYPDHESIKGQLGGSAPKGAPEGITKYKTENRVMKVTSDLPVAVGKKGKTTVTIKAGEEINGIYSFAGKGSDTNLVVAGFIAKQYGGNPSDWGHLCGFSKVTDANGVKRDAEIHWFEHEEIGQIKFKVKERNAE